MPRRALKDGYDAIAGKGPHFTHQALGRHIDPAGLGGYYCDFGHKAEAALETDHGFLHYYGMRLTDVVPVAQTALGYWELHLEGRPTRDAFLRLADWLVETAEPGPKGVIWRTRRPEPKYGVPTGYPSAMGQGEAVSVLLRAHDATSERRYLEVARAAFEPMTVAVEDGGVSRELDGRLVLEEYPSPEPAAILNGWIFALLGVHELVTVTGDEGPRDLFERSYTGLLDLLPRYDVGWWSLYSLYDHGWRDLSKPFYQRLHSVLLDALNLVRPDPRLSETARRWEAQLTAPAVARVAVNKLAFRVRRAL